LGEAFLDRGLLSGMGLSWCSNKLKIIENAISSNSGVFRSGKYTGSTFFFDRDITAPSV
jgi:hypothetical protein